jgi:hypothetical protein
MQRLLPAAGADPMFFGPARFDVGKQLRSTPVFPLPPSAGVWQKEKRLLGAMGR